MTYEGSGVSYAAMDPFKVLAQGAARTTASNIKRLGFAEVPGSRGESAYLVETPWCYLALVEEGLGTKNLVADYMYLSKLRLFFNNVAQCTVAMIVNDMITLGALPVSVAMHLAVGDSAWFKDEPRAVDLVNGWKRGCDLARCTWGPGETPTLKEIVEPGTFVLSGSAMGVILDKSKRIIPDKISDGDVIILIESSGVHANGLTLARKIGRKIGFMTEIDGGRSYGETLLDPTMIYVSLVEGCLDNNVDVHYAVNITGHGWRKLMRAPQPFTYVINQLPTQLPIFDIIQKEGPVDEVEMYSNYNMGAGFALYVPEKDADMVIKIASRLGYRALRAGFIRKNGKKQVVIEPKDITFREEDLAVR